MIEAITQEEFEGLPGRRGTIRSPEARAMLALNPLEGFRVPCRWKHRPTCGGAVMLHRRAYAHSLLVSTSCKDGTLYVFRYE